MLGEIPKCHCGEPARYTRGEGRKQLGFCQAHAPREVLAFQAVAFAGMRRGDLAANAKADAERAAVKKLYHDVFGEQAPTAGIAVLP